MTNGEKYRTSEERTKRFREFCHSNSCDSCPIGDDCKNDNGEATFLWLDMDAEEEKPLPCPWCGGESVVAKSDYGAMYVKCSNSPCGAEGPASQTSDGAVAMWNKVARRF